MKKIIYEFLVKTKLIYIWRAIKEVRRRGIKESWRYLKFKISIWGPIRKIRHYSVDNKLEDIIRNNKDKTVILSLSFIDWKVPLYQRPQHIAIQLAKKGFLYFYNTRNYYDYMDGYEKIGENMYLTNRYDEVYERLSGVKKYIHVYSTNMYEEDDERIDRAIKNGDKILYEYIDEISEKISCKKIPQFVIDRHERLLKDEKNCIVIATATKLYNDVAKHRKKNFKLVTNGVVYEHFSDIEYSIPDEMKSIVESGKTVVGYYGALASWFDYSLIKNVAEKRKDWEIVLIGWDYDGSLGNAGLNKLDNIKVMGPVDYADLPMYAQWFDVSTIPFKINEVTESTSPVKLFEYMALGKPIVTTAMPECKKYSSVSIAKNEVNDFIKKIEDGLSKSEDKKYLELLKKEGLENTWEGKAKEIGTLLS
ncbi:MAG: glycosyltransferase [Candidatus Dojkabacteria bacterium]